MVVQLVYSGLDGSIHITQISTFHKTHTWRTYSTYGRSVTAQHIRPLNLAVLPALVQDWVRLLAKLARGRLIHLGLHFDWMDGQVSKSPCILQTAAACSNAHPAALSIRRDVLSHPT